MADSKTDVERPMPQGARETECEECGYTYGTHAPTCPERTDKCEDCNERLITGLDARCDPCRNLADERAYERSENEAMFRGGEAAAYEAEQMAEARKLK